MKKALLGILAAVAALSVVTTAAFAAGPGGGRCFVDADGDGICDNAGTRCVYADADGDGVCDNAASCRGSGCGRGFHGGHGNGFCGGYGR